MITFGVSNEAISEGAEQPNVLYALTRKRAEIAGLIEQKPARS
jgi:hypothetical protein